MANGALIIREIYRSLDRKDQIEACEEMALILAEENWRHPTTEDSPSPTPEASEPPPTTEPSR